MSLEASELILNADGSIYHLNLKPENIAPTIITVGDPDRVQTVAQFFDSVEFKTQKREFHTQTGSYKGKKITVISTGIGTDNIDIVLNELDALVNIDFKNRKIKDELIQLDIIRIGTSGSIQKAVPLDSFLFSETAIGFDSLLHYYAHDHTRHIDMAKALERHLAGSTMQKPYIVDCSPFLKSLFSNKNQFLSGITATNVGFYAPQGRNLRAKPATDNLVENLADFTFNERKITNLEMETSGIYGMAQLLGHRAISLNAIVANRSTGKFSQDPQRTTETLIRSTLDILASM